MQRIGFGSVIMVAFAACVLGFTGESAPTNEPHRVFEAAGRTVVVDAGTRTVTFDGAPLAGAQRVADAVEMLGYLFVLQSDGVVHVYELPKPPTHDNSDGVATHVQTFEHLGRGTRTIIAAPRVERVLLLAAGSTEVMGMKVHERELIDDGTVGDPVYTDHARFMEFLRREDGTTDEPRTMAVSLDSLALVTDKELIDLFYLNRSYAVLSRSPLPDGVARVDAIVYAGERWILAGLNASAEPVLMVSDAIDGAWTDLGVAALDAALADEDGPIAWVPGQFTVDGEGDGERIHLAIRGERGAVASWPASARALTDATVTVRWLDGGG